MMNAGGVGGAGKDEGNVYIIYLSAGLYDNPIRDLASQVEMTCREASVPALSSAAGGDLFVTR